MALSNIFREPRREITESVVGLTVFGLAAWADYSFGRWLQEYAHITHSDGTGFDPVPWPMGMIAGVLIAIGAVFVVLGTHALGDVICNALQRNGIHLRPRQRR